MSAVTLSDLARAGIVATAAGGRLRLSAPTGLLTQELRQRIAGNRDGLLDDLAALDAICDMQAGRERMDAGLPPLEWGEPVARNCDGCGPVLLWATCPDPVKACPWCFRRVAGKAVARPEKTSQPATISDEGSLVGSAEHGHG